jgi:hypothetical protein
MKTMPNTIVAMMIAMGINLPEPYERAIEYSFCGECPFLSVTEKNQKRHEKHFCKKYNRQVFHMRLHPNIVRVAECDEPETKTIPLRMKDENKT